MNVLAALVALGLAAGTPTTADLLRELIEAGELDRAEALLNDVEGDGATVATFRGWIALERDDPKAAAAAFRAALQLDPKRDRLWLYVGQAELILGEFAQAEASLLQATSAANENLTLRLRARAARGLKRWPEAWQHLVAARTRAAQESPAAAPVHRDLLWEQGALLAEMGAPHAFGEHLHTALTSATWPAEELRRWADAALAVGAPPATLALLCAPAALDAHVLAQCARAYARWGHDHAAADLLSRAAALDVELSYAAADQLTRAERYPQALALNARVAVVADRLAQRAAIYLRAGEPERTLALAPSMQSAGVLACHEARCPGLNPRLQLAYAALTVGDVHAAHEWIAPLPHNDEVRALREALAARAPVGVP